MQCIINVAMQWGLFIYFLVIIIAKKFLFLKAHFLNITNIFL